ncbi:uncharacterized protein B0T15DRAFT_435256 [Chaetomium strumarium]|uniref:Rhodopsin domain-containing protein n=1 Tax=Chaetomium strumarium TaxID=1170767 RepID=A0AAJ0GTQ2_9PEZI|nr:hypothetical protein B0T15DRAFT_435256 [Chaetomium strumarium]
MSKPSGAASTTIDPARAAESNTATIIAVVTIFHAIAIIFVSLRVYARAIVIKSFGFDDISILLAALCALGGWIVFIIQSRYGLGKHQDTISREDMVTFQHAAFWQSIISATWALGFLKISIGFNLLRLSSSRWFRVSLWATIVFVCCYTFMGMMTFLLYCNPMEGFWNKTAGAKCYPLPLFVTFALINTSFNIFTDVLFATFPVPIIWTLKMKRKLRIYLIGILSLGYFAVVMGIVKAVYQIAYAKEADKTFRQSVQFWGFLQLNIGMIAACATSLKPLFKRILKLGSSYPYNTPAYGSRYGYGTRSRVTGLRKGTETGKGQQGGNFQGTVNEYELENGIRSDGNMSNGKGETFSTATSFYKHGSADGSGSEERILGAAGVMPQPPPHAITTDEAAHGIVMTTEVRVTVK